MYPKSTLEPGTEAPLGRYRLLALLGQGGMADVYLACTQGPRNFTKLLVVKLARFSGDPMFATMFLEEARLAAQLSHPNVVQTFEIGEEGSRYYIVMEYLDGGVLSRLRQKCVKTGGIPLRTALTIMVHVLEGLEYAHEAVSIEGKQLKVVHRDLSPSNIMVTAQGVVKILDFGIAKAADTQGFTQTGKFSGKLAYMPPEQLRGERVDQRADLFSAGVIIAESALNEKLWGKSLDPEIASKLGQGLLPSLDREGKPIDPELRKIVDRALAIGRDERYASASEMKADLVKYLDSIGGLLPQKELADFVRKTIEDDRAKLQTVIDSQLARKSLQTWGGETPLPSELPRIDRSGSRSKSPVILDDATVKSDVVVEDDEKELVVSRPSAPSSSKKPLLFGVLGLAAVVAIGAIVVLGKNDDKPRAEPAALPAQPTQPTQPPTPQTVRLEVVASPSDAQVALDGKPLGQNPYVGQLARDGNVHELTITAPGYRTMRQQITLERDASFRTSLEKELAVAPVPPVKTEEVATPPSTGKRTPTRVVTKKKTTATTAGTGTGSATIAVQPPPPPPPDPKKSSTLDTDPYAATKKKRSLDSDVLDGGGSNKQKKQLENPWQK